MTTQLPYADPGRASFEVIDTYTNQYMLSGNEPPLAPAVGLTQKPSTALSQGQVVTFDTDGTIIAAVYSGSNAYQACGWVAQASTVDSGGGSVLVFYQGCPNIDFLGWDASFNTDAKKLGAFRGAPTPTQIIPGTRNR